MKDTLKAAMKMAFQFFDEDNSGSIDAAELGHILRSLGHDPSKTDVNTILANASSSGDGSLDFQGFTRWTMPFLMEKMR